MKNSVWMASLFIVFTFMLGACQAKEDVNTSALAAGPIEAKLEVQETADVNEAVSLSVTVTQGSEAVTDADEVEFEVWEDGLKSASQLIPAKHSSTGKYEADTTFSKGGTYVVQVHVTARNMHTMPITNIQVGEEAPVGTEEAEEHKETGDHHDSDASIRLAYPGQITSGVSTDFAVDVVVHGEVLSGADVQLEIQTEGNDKHEWLSLTEKEGRYVGVYTFPTTGKHTIQVHVTKENEIHDHIAETIEVQEI